MPHDLSNDDLQAVTGRMARYCATQERCILEVTQKMQEQGVPGKMIPVVIEKLVAGRFIDELRYAKAFAVGKLRQNKWGRIKTGYELKGRRIPEPFIREAFQEIDEDEYRAVLRDLIQKKMREIKSGKSFNIREKIINFVRGKGFEYDLAAGILNELKI